MSILIRFPKGFLCDVSMTLLMSSTVLVGRRWAHARTTAVDHVPEPHSDFD
ncbi:hypothetical protein [Bifidobacterium crudilactis]|uniref:hypothetical protein n=1 Tax=Bifidobacterium crudilactis TaxID=327277 RepID=UPI002F3503D5